MSNQPIPRKYFSGGTQLTDVPLDFAMSDQVIQPVYSLSDVQVNMNSAGSSVNNAMFGIANKVRDSRLVGVLRSIQRVLPKRTRPYQTDELYTVKEGGDYEHFGINVRGKKIEIIRRDKSDELGRVFFYFSPPNKKDDECFIYTQWTSGALGLTAIRGIRVPKDARRQGMMRLMIRVILDRYKHIRYVHEEVRNAVLLKELSDNFGFKPVSPDTKSNAYYLSRDLTRKEVAALGNTHGTYKKGRRAFISSKDAQELLRGVPQEIRDQYVVVDNLDVIVKDAKATKLYLGEMLYRNPAMSTKHKPSPSRAMSASPLNRYDKNQLAKDTRSPIDIFLANPKYNAKYKHLTTVLKRLAGGLGDYLRVSSHSTSIKDELDDYAFLDEEIVRGITYKNVVHDMIEFGQNAYTDNEYAFDARQFLWKMGIVAFDAYFKRKANKAVFDQFLPLHAYVPSNDRLKNLPILDVASGERAVYFMSRYKDQHLS